MSLASNFRRTYEHQVAAATTGAAVRAAIAQTAAANVAELIRDGSASPLYRRFVDGVENAPNENVRLDNTGVIVYQFSSLAEAAGFALDFARNASPVETGEYRDAWYLLVNRQPYTSADLAAIPLGSEVTLSNHADYHRKIDVGGMRMRVAPQIVERTRQAVLRKFPTIYAERIFITIPGGYVLRGHAVRSGISYDKKAKKFVQLHPPKRTNRADARAGEMMTYPSLAMSEAI